MVDTIPPPPPHPPKELTPQPGSEEWFLVEENRTKRKNFGAGLGFAADEKIRNFVFEMSFASKTDDANTTINIYNPHKAFITKLLAITEGDAHVMPTAKGREHTDATTSTKSPIISADAFPKTTYQHGQFFERTIYYNETTNRTVVKIMHQVLMKEPIHLVKKKMIDFLQTNKIWLKNGDLDSVETSGFGWFFAAHDSMVFRPTLKNTITKLIQAIPTSTLHKAIKEYGSPEDEAKLPEIFLNPKWQSFGNHPKRVQTHAITISCVNNKIRLMKELVCLIPKKSMPFQFVHIGLATTNHPDTYWKSIVANNDNQNAVQGITVKGFSPELLSKRMKNKENVMASVATHFLNFRSIISIEETHKTQETGRYIFIVQKNDFVAAQEYIANFCSTVFQKLYPTEDARSDYRVMYQHHPHLVASPTAGGAVGANGDYLVEMLSQVETARGQPFSIHGTYAAKVAPRIIIEHESEFPTLPGIKKSPQSYLHSTNDTNPIATNNSESTRAATKTGITSSGHTLASQEVSIAISEMKSIMSSMFDRQEKYMRQAAQEAKDAAREAKLEAKEAAAEAKREASEAAMAAKKEATETATRMQEFLVNMMEMMIAANPQIKRKPKNNQRRPSRQEQQRQSLMWQASRQNESKEPKNIDPIFTDEYMESMSQGTNEYGNLNEYDSNAEEEEEEGSNNDIQYADEKAEDEGDEAESGDDLYMENETDLKTHLTKQTQQKETQYPSHNRQIMTTDITSPAKTHDHDLKMPSKTRSRTRSPGSSPNDGQKIQRTGKAKPKPSKQERTAQILNFEGMHMTTSIPAAPDP